MQMIYADFGLELNHGGVCRQMGTGPLGAERVLILTLKNAPIYDNTTRTLTYNASLILKNTTVLSDPQLSPVTSLVNNIARAAQEYLINLKDAGGKLPTFNMTDIQLFIDNVGGTPVYFTFIFAVHHLHRQARILLLNSPFEAQGRPSLPHGYDHISRFNTCLGRTGHREQQR